MMNLLNVPLPEVKNRNQQIQMVANRVYTFAQQDVYLVPVDQVNTTTVQIKAILLGKSVTFFASLAMVNAILQPLALQFETMSADAIELWLLHQTPKMPEQFQITQITLCDPPNADWFVCQAYDGATPTEWYLGFTEIDTIAQLLNVLRPYCRGVMPSQLASFPINIPLTATTLALSPEEIFGLEVGDVLILEGIQ